MADLSHPNTPFSNNPDDHLARLLVDDVETPWYKTFIQDLKEYINPPKLPPLELTSKPVAVKDIWGLYGRQKKSFMMSTGGQALVVALVFIAFSTKPVQDAAKTVASLVLPVDIAPAPIAPAKKQTMQGGGGGGDRSPLPASKGRLPKAALRQFTPPSAVLNNPNPKLAMEPTILAPPDVQLPNVNMSQYGDPLGKLGPASNGPGSGGGIGSGKGGGVGSGTGGGVGPGEGGGIGGGPFRVGGGVTAPVVLHKVEPEYSEEARKAKYQGTVLLYIEVDPSGRATNIRVQRSLGLGLDEKAIEAVKQWKFKPGYKDGRPVTVAATIEVNFRLL
ncbi:MAG TPA: energy transducer TonB [Bryobacteraceae bacterium]|nr:energy transducer TonB [Bryobacteraceae bacterium]